MSTRSVRLDDEAEAALSDIVNRTGLSISDAIKQGLIVYQEKSLATAKHLPADFFRDFDLGQGGYTAGPARQAKNLLKNKLNQQHRERGAKGR